MRTSGAGALFVAKTLLKYLMTLNQFPYLVLWTT